MTASATNPPAKGRPPGPSLVEPIARGTVLYWGYRVRAERLNNGSIRWLFRDRWIDSDPMTAATFEAD